MTIRNRITLWFTLLVTVLMLISGAIGWLSTREQLYADLRQDLQAKTEKIQEVYDAMQFTQQQLQPNQIFNPVVPELLSEIVAREGHSSQHGSYMQLATREGQIFSRSFNLGQRQLALSPPGTQREELMKLPNNRAVRVLYASRTIQIQGQPAITLQLALPLTELDRILSQALLWHLLELVVLIIFAVLMGQFLSRRALAPMVRMTEDVQAMEADQALDRRVDLSQLSPDEIHELAQTFNGLLDHISHSMDQQERFIADASHEMRSPLTVIRGHAQLVRKRGLEHPELFEECLENVIQETHRLERLVTDMLILARSRQSEPPDQELDLVALLRQIVMEYQPVHPQIQASLPDQVLWVQGDPDALKRVVINLLDNALRAILPEGQVDVSLRVLGAQAEVMVLDNGTGIEAQHLPHLFDRFYRVDSARNRADGGSGLGLAISKEIIETHGGRLVAQSEWGQGSRFVFWLPLIQTDEDEVKD